MAEPLLSQEINDPQGYISHARYFSQPITFSQDVTFQGRKIHTVHTFADADATPSVRSGYLFKTANTGATTITDFDDGLEGQEILISFNDANTTITDGGNIALSGAFTSTTNDIMRLVKIGSTWQEQNRSVN